MNHDAGEALVIMLCERMRLLIKGVKRRTHNRDILLLVLSDQAIHPHTADTTHKVAHKNPVILAGNSQSRLTPSSRPRRAV